MIDLHSHTTASDGEHPPAELLGLARAAGVTALAVTDHDTVSGLAAAGEAARAHGIELVPGIEITAFLHRREVHVLGHFVDPGEERLASFAAHLKVEREKRMEQMVAKIRGLGFPVTMDQVRALAGDTHFARPHLARVLVQLGYCSSTKEAFDRFLADGRPGAVPRYELAAEDAVTLIRGAGGAATIAHPGVSRIEKHDLEALKKAGLAGVEVEHSDHPPSLREKLRGIARELDLISTSGSDYHGPTVSPNRHLGTESMTRENFDKLRARAGR
jgi:predicted metal-dependent phosphoesterase TrpH